MKTLLRKIVANMLASLARFYLSKKKVTVIGVTGSFGKTSTKDAIAFLLEAKFAVAKSKKSLNTEFGLPLAILELPSGFSNPFKWLGILFLAMFEALFEKPAYDKLILEYGADKPGDMDFLLRIVKPDIAVLTEIAPVHLGEGQFENIDAIAREKWKLISSMGQHGTAVVNGDNRQCAKMIPGSVAKTMTFGISETNTASARNITTDLSGISADISYGGQILSLRTGIVGDQHLNLFLASLLVGKACGIEMEEGIRILQMYKLPPGRFSVIEGKNNSVILDSSYNSSPETAKTALKILKGLSAKRKICVLGNMNELGEKTENFHRDLSASIMDACDIFIAVGENMKFACEEILKKGFPKGNMIIRSNAEEAGEEISKILKEGDLILFKGSQNKIRLEKAVKMAMEHPEDAKKLLCRQEKEWEYRT